MSDTIKIVYYYGIDQGLCPGQEYLAQFLVDRNNSRSTGVRNLKLLADIDAKFRAFEKPDNYDTNRLRREVDKQFIVALRYKEKFIFNRQRYEEYN